MKQNKNKFTICVVVLLILSIHSGFSQQAPGIEWQKSFWADTYPTSPQQPNPPFGWTGTIPQSASSEDWFYMMTKSTGTNGKTDAYICAGYSTFINYAEKDDQGPMQIPMPTQGCEELEWTSNTGSYLKGTNKHVMAKVGLDGTLLWYHTYANGALYNVIQTSDGGYLGFGDGSSAEDGHGNLVAYNPGQGGTNNVFISPDAAPKGTDKGHLRLVKLDHNGNLQWQYMYGMEPYNALDHGASAYMTPASCGGSSAGGGLAETSEGNIMFTARAGDKNFPTIYRACVIEVDQNGMWKWGKYYGPTNAERSIGTAIKRTGTGANQKFYVSGTEYYPSTEIQRAFLMRIDNTISPTPDWKIYVEPSGGASSTNSGTKSGSTLDINAAGELLYPLVKEVDALYTDEIGTGCIERVNTVTGAIIGEINIGEIVAYDLTVSATATADGGFAVASSKHQTPQTSAWFPDNSTNQLNVPGLLPCAYSTRIHRDCGATDAYVGKYSASFTKEWETIFDSNTHRPPGDKTTWNYPDIAYYRDIRLQECIYAVVQSPDGGFVVAGNNSENFDDSYIVKLASTCTHTQLANQTISNSGPPQLALYTATDYIHTTNVIINSPSNVEFKAGNEITISSDFLAANGSGFYAHIDPSLDCTPVGGRFRNPSNNNNDISQASIFNRYDDVKFEVFPNPNNGIFNVVFSDNNIKSIIVYSLIGDKVFEKTACSDKQINIDISQFKTGLYLVKVIEGNTVTTKKILHQ